MSASAPADSTAANSTAKENAKPSPTRPPASTRPPSASTPLGTCWPCSAIGVSPIASATAITTRTRGGTIVEENGGAIRNSGVSRASTRMKPASSLPASLLSARVSGASVDRGCERRVHGPTSDGIEVYRPAV